ncbi:hypothetical protein [Agrobacterium tumefaciens]|uniref:hypothetical protein n=1 Tax=Agrobacterium tumefaciens TaxID=358 RepID=UPI001573A9E5|nr:hypothetical protein [Agrobacterium tumefaciens]NSX90384.1 hypothetical protein [Agrobacterium tumefaciens]
MEILIVAVLICGSSKTDTILSGLLGKTPEASCFGRSAAGKVAKEGKILLRLPYSEMLYKMTGAPRY